MAIEPYELEQVLALVLHPMLDEMKELNQTLDNILSTLHAVTASFAPTEGEEEFLK